MAGSKEESLRAAETSAVELHRPASWDDMGQAFETMGKLSLALAVGMSAAALFCKLAEQGKVRVPSVSSLLMHSAEGNENNPKGPKGRRS